jgi:RNase P/RNase MRP subunit p29
MPEIINKNEIKKSLIFNSLIGKNIKIINSLNKCDLNLSGKIINETKLLFHILTKENKIKKILKENITFELDKKFEINGNILKNTLISRIKKMK